MDENRRLRYLSAMGIQAWRLGRTARPSEPANPAATPPPEQPATSGVQTKPDIDARSALVSSAGTRQMLSADPASTASPPSAAAAPKAQADLKQMSAPTSRPASGPIARPAPRSAAAPDPSTPAFRAGSLAASASPAPAAGQAPQARSNPTPPASDPFPAAPAAIDAPPAWLDEPPPWSDDEPPHALGSGAVSPSLTPEPPADAEPAQRETASLDWDALEASVADCRRCKLCETRTKTVFGVGDRHAELMFVGEGPGQDEDQQGEPFVGRAGQLLTKMLAAVGLTRDQVYIANIVKCRPPRNRNPAPEEAAACRAYLERQIDLIQPKLIVSLGAVSANNLLGNSEAVGRLRGRIHHYQPPRGTEPIPLIATYHPSYYLRSPADKAKGWQDLQHIIRSL